MAMYKGETVQAVRPATMQDMGPPKDADAAVPDIVGQVTITMANGLTLVVDDVEVTGLPNEPLSEAEMRRLSALRSALVRTEADISEMLALEARPGAAMPQGSASLIGRPKRASPQIRAHLTRDIPLTPAADARLTELRAMSNRTAAQDAEMKRLGLQARLRETAREDMAGLEGRSPREMTEAEHRADAQARASGTVKPT